MLSKQTMMNILVVRIKVIQYYIGIAAMTGCKDNNLEILAQILENFKGIGAYIDSCFYNLACWKGYRQFDIIRRR